MLSIRRRLRPFVGCTFAGTSCAPSPTSSATVPTHPETGLTADAVATSRAAVRRQHADAAAPRAALEEVPRKVRRADHQDSARRRAAVDDRRSVQESTPVTGRRRARLSSRSSLAALSAPAKSAGCRRCCSSRRSSLFFVGLVARRIILVEGLAVMVAVILATGVAFLSEYRSDREFEVLNAAEGFDARQGACATGQFHTVAAGGRRGRRSRAAGNRRRDSRRRPARQGDRVVRRSIADDRRIGAGAQAAAAADDRRRPRQPGCLYRGTQVVDGVGADDRHRGRRRDRCSARSPADCRPRTTKKRRRAQPRPNEDTRQAQADHLEGTDAAASRS